MTFIILKIVLWSTCFLKSWGPQLLMTFNTWTLSLFIKNHFMVHVHVLSQVLVVFTSEWHSSHDLSLSSKWIKNHVIANVPVFTQVVVVFNLQIFFETGETPLDFKRLGSDCIFIAPCAIWEKLGTILQAYSVNPCTKFTSSPTTEKSTLKG